MSEASIRLQTLAKQAIAEYNAQIKEGEPAFPQWAYDTLELIDEHAAMVARITSEHALIVAGIKEHHAAEIATLQLAVESARQESAQSVAITDEQLAKMLIASELDSTVPKLSDELMVKICEARDWSTDSTPAFRDIAHAFWAEACMSQRKALATPSQQSNLAVTDEQINRAKESALHVFSDSCNHSQQAIDYMSELLRADAKLSVALTDAQIMEMFDAANTPCMVTTAHSPWHQKVLLKFARALLSSVPAPAEQPYPLGMGEGLAILKRGI